MILIKNKLLLSLLISTVCFSITAQNRNSNLLKNDLRFLFGENVTGNMSLDVLVPKWGVGKDSSYAYSNTKKKLTIHFKVTNVKGACKFAMTDSLNNRIVIGQFIDGLELLREQEEAFNTDGDRVIELFEYYRGIADGEWMFYNFNKELIKKVGYDKGFIKK